MISDIESTIRCTRGFSRAGHGFTGIEAEAVFGWVKRYRQSLGGFTVDYKRGSLNRRIGKEVEEGIGGREAVDR